MNLSLHRYGTVLGHLCRRAPLRVKRSKKAPQKIDKIIKRHTIFLA